VTQGASLFAVTALGRAGVPLVERADRTVSEVERTYATAQVLSDAPTGAGETPGPVRPVNAGQIAGSRFYLVGGITTLLNRKGQRLGDLAAGTVVIRIPRLASPDLESLLGSRFNSLRTQPHLAARLRQRIHAAEAAIALQALLRRDDLEPAARIALFRSLADDFRAQVAFPPDIAESLTDEQFVRNVVDLLYRPKAPATTPPVQAQA
jgi:hypothetical protein